MRTICTDRRLSAGGSRSADSAGCDFHLLHADGADSQAQSAALGADAAIPVIYLLVLRVGGLLHDAIGRFANALLAHYADGRGGCTGAAAEATSASEITNGYKFALWGGEAIRWSISSSLCTMRDSNT